MSTDAIRELLDLTAVHGFYKLLLEHHLGHPVPVPMEKPPEATGDPVDHSTVILKRWLRVLDMAISPPMVRDALRELSGRETCEALLRYYVLKASTTDTDRDKTDFVATWLYRNPVPNSKRTGKFTHGESHDAYFFFAQQAMEFENELLVMLGNIPKPELPEEHRQLLREFEFIYNEVEDLRTFDQLMDSGLMQKVREIKNSFGKSFYHPDVLSIIAAYNVYFGNRFDELFREAARQIKTFAEKVQQEGGSIMSRVDGDVIVKHLTEVEENSILRTEYHRAQEQFRKVSKMKKAVDSRRFRGGPGAPISPIGPGTPLRGIPAVSPTVVPPATATPAPPAAASAAPQPQRTHSLEPIAENVVTGHGLGTTLEDGKIRATMDSIRNFVRAADPRSSSVVPMRHGNISLSPGETEAFRADYRGEKSFRAEYAETVMELIGVLGRMMVELDDFRSKQNSAYLWKPHADSLTFLLTAATRCTSEATAVVNIAQQRGLTDKVNSLNATIQKIRTFAQDTAKALQSLNGGAPGSGRF